MIVYQHRRLDTDEIFYIGIGKTEKRAYSIHSRSRFWKRIANKTDYLVEIVTTCDTWKEACQIEQYLIKYYGRKDLGLGSLVNLTDGGEGRTNVVVSDGTRLKMSKSQTGKKRSDETKAKISKARTGKKLSEETRDRISESNIGRKAAITCLILDTQTGVIYDSIKEASFYYDIKRTTLNAMLNGRRKNKTNLIKI